MRKRKHVVSFHLSAKELRHLETQTALSGLNREEFLRTLIMGAELRERPCEHHADLLRKISGLCNNANQLARLANTYKEADSEKVELMLRLVRAVWEEVRDNW